MKNRKPWRAVFALALCIALLCGMFVSAEELIPAYDAAANDAQATEEMVAGLDDLGDIDDLSVIDDISTLDLDASLALDGELLFIDPQSPAIDPDPETGIIDPETEVTGPEVETSEPETEVTGPEAETAEPETETAEPETEVTEPETETAEPETETTEPETETAEPEAETAGPETETETAETETPEAEAETPEAETAEPEAEATETETAEGELPAETEEAQMADATQYTVTFLGADGKPLQTKANYSYNDKLEYICQTPTKDADEMYSTYDFDGWVDSADTSSNPTVYTKDNLPNVTANKTYKAHFKPKSFTLYTVTFVDDAGATLQSVKNYHYKDALEYTGQKPTKAADKTYKSYAFDGWVDTADTKSKPTVYPKDNLPNVTANKTYKAHFAAGDFWQYTVVFVNDSGTVLQANKEYHYNDKLTYTGATPTKTDSTYIYTFAGWVRKSDGKEFSATAALPNVTASERYTAVYTSQPKGPVQLEVRYKGQSPLSKVYDCNKYGVYTQNGEMHVLIDQWKDLDLTQASDIKKQLFGLYLSPGSSLIKGHETIGYSLTGLEQFASADAGVYRFKFTFKLTGDDADYYKLKKTTIEIPAKITKREVVVTPRAGLSKTYGAKDPVYKDGSWLDSDESSPLHQDISGLPGYAVPVNTVDGKLTLTVTNAAYIKQYATEKGIKFFNDWLIRTPGELPGKYRIKLGNLNFGPNFRVKIATEYFTINKKNISDANVTATISDQKYTGSAIQPGKYAIVLKYGDKRLLYGTDYKIVSYANNKNVSTASSKATVKIQGIGKRYTGTRTVQFSIVPAAITSATAGAIADRTYTGSAIQPAPVLKYKGTLLKKGTDYTLAYANNKNVGRATITVTGKGKFKGSRKLYFNIIPKGTTISKLTTAKKQATLTWNKGNGITGYQVEFKIYNDSGSVKKLNVSNPNTTSRNFYGLTSGKIYVFRIRTYKTVNGKAYYSAWSAAKNIIVK